MNSYERDLGIKGGARPSHSNSFNMKAGLGGPQGGAKRQGANVLKLQQSPTYASREHMLVSSTQTLPLEH